ncbi:Sorting nexin mvp1 [Podila horticola]|nr:Sorting nexin mvp1 [Podila horticola]
MTAVEETTDAMTASFAASTFDAEVNDPWGTTTARGLSPHDILNIVVAPTRSRVTKGECSVALALAAMAQKNMDLTIENLTAHREDLPIPFLPGLESIDFGSSGDVAGYSTPTLPRHPVHMGSTVSDPWRSSVIATKGNGYPPAPSYLASPPITSAELPTAADPEAARKEMYQWFLNVDTIRITFAPEKEGIFLFKHTNYIVESKNRATTVIRRYSDFHWLLEVLFKRFPYRILPNLPPKRIGMADETFLERRLRGLTRFMNALMRHPELALWRKNVVISTEDEFTTRLPISESLAKQVPATVDLELEAIKRRVPASIEYYRSMVHMMDRIQKRTEANASDYMRFSLSLSALADCEKHCHIEECYNCGQLSQGYGKIATKITQASHLTEENALATQQGVVENLKRHRDLLVSVRELLQRRDHSREGGLAETLKKRIASNETKLKAARAAISAANAAAANAASGALGSGPAESSAVVSYEAQIEKLTHSINSDKAELELQGQRAVLLQHTLWMEMMFFHKSHAMIATMYQNFVHEQMKTSQSLFDNWKALSPIVHDLPMEVNGFN